MTDAEILNHSALTDVELGAIKRETGQLSRAEAVLVARLANRDYSSERIILAVREKRVNAAGL